MSSCTTVKLTNNELLYSLDNLAVSNNSSISAELSPEILKRLLDMVNGKTQIKECKCVNCGAPLGVEYNKPVMICKYCGSSYLIGTQRINDRG